MSEPLTERLYVFEVDATAGETAGYVTGDRHGLMAFAKGLSQERAQAAALAEVRAQGWTDAVVGRGAEFRGQGAAADFQAAVAQARAQGAALVIYRDPLKRG